MQSWVIRLTTRQSGHSARVSQTSLALCLCVPLLISPGGRAGIPPPMLADMRHGLTLVRGLTHHLLPWPAGAQTRCKMGQRKSAGRNKMPRGMRAAEPAKGETVGPSDRRCRQLCSSHRLHQKAVQAVVLTHLPAAIPVSQEPKHYAEHHVAKKHHLGGMETELCRVHSPGSSAV